jgi:hypothetical protein
VINGRPASDPVDKAIYHAVMSEWPGVFISSTCYDLIDLRAELEAMLRDLGLHPVLSDRPTSEFDTSGYRDSITTCLENVKKCPTFVCVLSNRYGPRLGKAGFDDISATHLEYRTAVDERKRILFYVRDRLVSDLAVWKSAQRGNKPVPELPWVSADQYGIFELLAEHARLAPDDPNWYWQFRDSVELKQRIAFDLGAISRRARLERLVENDRLPLFAISSTGSNSDAKSREVTLEVRNLSSTIALQLQIGLDGEAMRHLADALGPGDVQRRQIVFEAKLGQPVTRELVLQYATSHGHRIEERHSFESLEAGYAISRTKRSIRLQEALAFTLE